MSFVFFLNNWQFFSFVLILIIFLVLKRKRLDLQGNFPFLYILMYKTSMGLKKMKKWSEKHPKLFLYLSYYSIFVGVVGSIFVFFFMFWQLGYIVDNNIETGGGLVLPIQTEGGMSGAVPVLFVPFMYWIIGLFVLMIVHEFAHGVIAERFKVPIKSSGFAFFGLIIPILPGAFVEQDEKVLAKKKPWKQIAVFGAGSASNFLFGFLFLLMWAFIFTPVVNSTMEPQGLNYGSTLNGSSLNDYNLTSGTILSVDGHNVNDDMFEYLGNLTSNETVTATITNLEGQTDEYIINTIPDNENQTKGLLGVANIEFQYGNKGGYEFLGDWPLYIQKLFFWLWFLNIGIGLMNLLPLWITDGGQIVRLMLTSKIKNQALAMKIYTFISFLSLFALIFTLWPSLLMGFF
jgi:hypothetical protein